MTTVKLTGLEIMERAGCPAAGATDLIAATRIAEWCARNMVILTDDCPECGAVESEDERHMPGCEHAPDLGEEE
jgi:hypothetical protein